MPTTVDRWTVFVFRFFSPAAVALLAAVALALLLAAPAGATPLPQSTTGNVRGQVTDLNNAPLSGITVTATGTALPVDRTTVTDAEGRYRFVQLPPGSYELTFAIGGQMLVRRVDVTIGNGITVNASMALFQLAAEVVGEQVVVDVPSPAVDLQGTWVGSNFDEQMLQEVPQRPRYMERAGEPGARGAYRHLQRGRQRERAAAVLRGARRLVDAEQPVG